MKKTYLFLIFLAGFFVAKSQPLLDEGFESGVFPPAGWTLLNGNAPAGKYWKSNTDTSLKYVKTNSKPYPTYLGMGSMVYEADTINANAWAITPAMSLTAGVSYTVSFYYRVANDSFPEKLKVTAGTDTTINAQTTILWNNNGGTALANDTAWTQGRTSFTPGASGNFYFGFNCYSDSNRIALVLDNIKIEATSTAFPPCATRLSPANGATNVTAPEALFTWSTPSSATKVIFELGKTNPPDTIDIINASARYFSNLAYNTTYYWSVVPLNDSGSASGCPVYSFTTQVAPPIPANDNPAGAIAIAANGSVAGYTRSATQTQVADSCNGDIGNANDDVWYTFTPSQSGSAAITLTPDLNFDGVMVAYSGTPGSFVTIACADQGVEGQQEMLMLPNLTAGVTYYFRVYGYGDSAKDGSFKLTASGITLPVEITSFKGVRNGYINVLSWTTLTEQNNKGFELQRSANGRDFSSLKFISTKAADGNSSLELRYEFADVKVFAGNAYYRLKQIDIDGRSKTSNIVLLKGIQTNALTLSNVYPSPANSVINIILTAPSLNKVDIVIMDIAGKPVMRQAAQLASGSNNFTIYINKLPPGAYLIKAVCASGCETAVSKFIKQ